MSGGAGDRRGDAGSAWGETAGLAPHVACGEDRTGARSGIRADACESDELLAASSGGCQRRGTGGDIWIFASAGRCIWAYAFALGSEPERHFADADQLGECGASFRRRSAGVVFAAGWRRGDDSACGVQPGNGVEAARVVRAAGCGLDGKDVEGSRSDDAVSNRRCSVRGAWAAFAASRKRSRFIGV